MAESIRVKRERISPVIWIQMKSNLNVKVHKIKNNCLALVRAKLDCCCGTNKIGHSSRSSSIQRSKTTEEKDGQKTKRQTDKKKKEKKRQKRKREKEKKRKKRKKEKKKKRKKEKNVD